MESKLLKLEIPALDEQISRLVMKAHRTTKSTNGSYSFYVKAGNENPTPLVFDYIGEEIWNFGKGLVIHDKDEPLKAGSNFTILLVSDSNMTVYFKCEYE